MVLNNRITTKLMMEGGASTVGAEARPAMVSLDEKYFRRMKVFDGTVAMFREWLFDLLTCLGHIDNKLADAIRKLLSEDRAVNPKDLIDYRLPLPFESNEKELFDKYGLELFGVLSSLT